MSEQLTTLYRPTGPTELALVAASGHKRWPPRLPDQPIFYPVTSEQYAIEIARDWNGEASPVDRIWGIGIAADHEDARRPARWPGLNLLGFALMEARTGLAAA